MFDFTLIIIEVEILKTMDQPGHVTSLIEIRICEIIKN